ncbi:bifunctional acetate--CoA ligase family protein/GNAT family N-acetyltransferase [Caldinitratiruptor microaerophilus]|uniref:GNAT family N-acetyltransferase n=1 Tax=Caldinitratiruptor microaerophilus TaxID=671077 RepID=A0AA35CJA7_9FIRM|nr:GNAT family N-acetyltransferase [Caldinitratiruptor microaerophilus]BDG59408.1 GNAT family N-acetyltransferase [Caldinitratiruptor microaerophilus]
MVERVRDPARYSEHVVLRDGTVVLLRVAREEDEAAVADLFRRASLQSLRLRFFAAVSQVSPALIREFVTVDFENRAGLVAVHGDESGEKVIGIGTYVRLPRRSSAEVAFMVDDAFHGRGLGSLLLERLARIAVLHGIYTFEADVLAENRPMMQVFAESGFELTRAYEGGTIHVHFPMAGVQAARARAELRERVAVAASLVPFFRPRSVAVVGASRDPETISGLLFRNLIHAGFQGPVYPVNRSATSISGVRAYPSVAELPEAPDLALIAVPAAEVPEVVRESIAAGVRALVILTAGFAELGEEGRRRQREIADLARLHGLRLVGPNSMGLINTDPAVSLNASVSRLMPPRGRVGFLSQSGALGLSVLRYATELGLGFSTFVSVGNKADVSGNDLLQYWEEDADTDLILLYLESFGNPRKFARIARRVGARKPVLVVKSGRTPQGSRAALFHTAAREAGERYVEALFEQAGVIRANTLEEMFDAALLLAYQPLPRGSRVGVVTNSGGPAILCADACAGTGLEIPELSPHVRDELMPVVPAGSEPRNPLDLGPAAGPEEYERGLRAVLADPGIDAAIVIYVPVLTAETGSVAAAIRRAVAAAGQEKPVAACFMGTSGVAPLTGPDGPTIPSYRFPESAAIALGRVCAYARWRSRPAGRYVDPPGIRREEAHAVVQGAARAPRVTLRPAEAARLLDAYGIPCAGGRRGRRPPALTARVVQDPVFGPVIGVQGADGCGRPAPPVFRITPLTDADAAELVGHLGPLAPGGAGEEPVREGLADLLLRLSALIEDQPWVDEVELPLRTDSSGRWVAAGARVTLDTGGTVPPAAARRRQRPGAAEPA